MPHKFNTSRRHKFAKKKYRVTNWCGYNESLRNRGGLTVWITGDARKHWAAPRRRSRGGQPRYSDLAITMCLTLGMVYRLPLRQTQGLIRSISKLMLLEISVPDFSTLSRRGRGLSLPARPKIKITDPVHLAIDSTGLKVFDEGEWLQSKYNVKAKRKRWRKLHLGLNLVTGDIVCSDLTLDDVGDPTVLPDLLKAHSSRPKKRLCHSPALSWREPVPECTGAFLASLTLTEGSLCPENGRIRPPTECRHDPMDTWGIFTQLPLFSCRLPANSIHFLNLARPSDAEIPNSKYIWHRSKEKWRRRC